MGAIQNSFNQFLGITAAVGGLVVKDFKDRTLQKEALSTDIKNTVDEMKTKEKEYNNAKTELEKKNPVGRPSKARQQALAKYQETVDAWESQSQSFTERLEILKNRQDLIEYQKKYGLFAEKKLEKDRFKEFKEKRAGGNK